MRISKNTKRLDESGLFPHNIDAYKNAVNRFDWGIKRTCIIHPTGTGKSHIIAKFVADNPHKKHLLITPSTFIIEHITRLISSKHFIATTFHTLLRMKETELIELSKCDYIYLDEFHRIGAEEWGARIERILEKTDAFVVGTSATPIRYLDDYRNMANELFNGDIASNLTLIQAFTRNILPSPKYVSALYSIENEYQALAKKIASSIHPQKKLLVEKLKRNVIEWQSARGIEQIIKKHLTRQYKKIVVFAKNIRHIEEAKKTLLPVLFSIYKDLQVFEIHSLIADKKNKAAFADFEKKDEAMHIMFSIDKLNEGIHVAGVDAIIMMRDTSSPIIFYQQLGRCLSAGSTNRPLVLDLVNNFRAIRLNEFKQEYQYEMEGLSNIEKYHTGVFESQKMEEVQFIDETKDIQDLFEIFSNSIEIWEIRYNEAKSFFLKHRHLNVTKKLSRLHNWLAHQRKYNREGILPIDKYNKLSNICMNWNPELGMSFDQRIAQLAKFLQINEREPSVSIENEKGLAQWIGTQRRRIIKGTLSADKKKKLLSFIPIENKDEQEWKNSLQKISEYYKLNGNLEISGASHPLRNIIKSIRRAYKEEKLSDARIDQLRAIGFEFRVKSTWEEMFSEFKKFKEKYNRITVPTLKSGGHPEEFAKYAKLYTWLTVQRRQYKKGKLSQERIYALIAAGFKF